jgi:hypothetical protein
MYINFILLGTLMKKQDDLISKQQQFIFLYKLVKLHH